ncbi:transposase [Streptomyces sp. NPDC006134]|uniref:transposase n=1 Tax=Streptomyces sp. NPDC006134 TaxID=3154467 RepID=UPI0033DB4CE8
MPDGEADPAVFTEHRCNNDGAGYPALRLPVLVSCGTRTLPDAVSGPAGTGERACAPRLLRSLHEDMIVLLDRDFTAQALVTSLARTGAQVLGRVKNSHRLPVLRRLPDGSFLSICGTVPVRVIDCETTVATGAGRNTVGYRQVTTPTGHRTHPADDLITLCHQRWKIETAYLEIKSPSRALPGGRVLRACALGRHRPGGVRAAGHLPGPAAGHGGRHRQPYRHRPRPGRLRHHPEHCPRPGLQAAGVIADTATDLVGTIGHRIPADLMPDHRHPHPAPRRQTHDLQVPRQRHRRPDRLQGHHQHRHPDHTRPPTARPRL